MMDLSPVVTKTRMDALWNGPKNSSISIEDYVVDMSSMLGKGGYGCVYIGTNSEVERIAAKTVNLAKTEKITNDLHKLMEMDHENIIKLFDIHHKIDNTLWIFMEYCQYGDLQRFFQGTNVNEQNMRTITMDIAKGVEYLHANHVIHRDIKPANILIANDTPLAKLADFDLSKFLEEGYDTSGMTTDVGTRYFKAPEFFQRDAQGRVSYHRNVDIYAAGLTYLAMVQRNKHLRPLIETPTDDDEKEEPIGRIIAERVRLKQDVRDVVDLELPVKPLKGDEDNNVAMGIKMLVQNMTCWKPQDRLSAREVVEELKTIGNSTKQVTPHMKLLNSWETKQFDVLSFADAGSTLLLRGKKIDRDISPLIPNQPQFIRVVSKNNGDVIMDIRSECRHETCCVVVFPGDPTFATECCIQCDVIRRYLLIINEETCGSVIYEKCGGPMKMCPGPDGSLLVLTKKEMLRLRWNSSDAKYELVKKARSPMKNVDDMYYVQGTGLLVCSSSQRKRVQAFDLDTGLLQWQFDQKVCGQDPNPFGLSSDSVGKIYVADGKNERLLVLDSTSGKLIQVLLKGTKLGRTWNVSCMSAEPQFTILTRPKIFECTVNLFLSEM